MIESLSLMVKITYHTFFLIEEGQGPLVRDDDAVNAGPARSIPGSAAFSAGRNDGPIKVDVEIAPQDPGARPDQYEDVVEIGFESRDGVVAVMGLSGNGYLKILPPLTAGPGSYTIRYHAKGMDQAEENYWGGEQLDSYLIQIWPARHPGPVIVKAGSKYARGLIERAGLNPD
ncbi:hypothetical protein ACQEU3_45085 [Spirillospora sp. CA-253888]